MDRLETQSDNVETLPEIVFIFQYGQIRNYLKVHAMYVDQKIYIPVWIDQKQR